jgi:hypothetical protein
MSVTNEGVAAVLVMRAARLDPTGFDLLSRRMVSEAAGLGVLALDMTPEPLKCFIFG